MAANYQAIGTAVGSAGSITTLAWPTHITDDLGLLFVETSNQAPGGTWPPTGWTVIESIPAGTTNTVLYVLWQRATSSAMGNVTITDSGDHQYAVIMTIRGAAKTGNPIHAYLNEAFSATTSPQFSGSCIISSNDLTLNTTDFLYILAASWDLDNASPLFSNWIDYFSGGLQERANAGTTQGNGGGIGIATKTATNTTFINGYPPFVTISSAADCAAWAIIIQPEPPALSGSGKKSAVASSC